MEAAGGKMDLRPRQRQSFSGFTDSEVQKMEHLLYEFRDQSLEDEFCKKLARVFNRSSRRAGKPVAKWAEIQSWFQQNLEGLSTENSFNVTKMSLVPEGLAMNKATETPKLPEANTVLLEGVNDEDLSKLEFEARSAKDGAWYDVDDFLSHRFLSSGDIEVRVRYVGLGDEEDEWVNVRESVRVCSIALEPSDCQDVNIGDLVVCFQTSQDQARYYDAHVVDIQRRWHDIRGCRCLFLIRYDHDNTEERVRLRRLCCRPNKLSNLE